MVKFSYKYLDDEWSKGYWKFVCDNSDKNLDWYKLSKNPNITWDIIQNNPDKPWDWRMVSDNPNIN